MTHDPSPFDRWIESSGVTQPDPDDEIACQGYIDQVLAWGAEHDPEGNALWESQLRYEVAQRLIDERIVSGEFLLEVAWQGDEPTTRLRLATEDEGEAR